VKRFYDEGIGKSLVQWSVAAGATTGWAKKLFPELSDDEALEKLWDILFAICRVDNPNYLDLWKAHNANLHRRAKALSELGVERLHFTGPGTDLVVGLSNAAIFKGGTDASPSGVSFEPNIPTEECFTTPDYRMTEGRVSATRPVYINGKLVEGLTMTFKEGEIVDFSAEAGAATFEEYISSDEGARRLGEVALVGIDSPIYQSGLVFQEILLDENAACHIAIGSAYKFCLKDGERLDEDELRSLGCNESCVHCDIMISSEEVSVAATGFDGSEYPVLVNGQWASIFA
jgi:aminopeptidase